QKRSWFSVALAFRRRPSAVTTSADRGLSHANPYLPDSQPIPPPRVRPAIPVSELVPPAVAEPKAWVSWPTSPHRAPPPAGAAFLTGSTWTLFMGDRSIRRPPLHDAFPATLWSPPRTAPSTLCARAKLTQASTSATPVQRAINAGRLSIMPFHSCRV